MPSLPGCVRIAWLSAGVGVYPLPASTRISIPWALKTLIAVWNAGSDSACVSRATNSGPVMPCALRWRAIASLIAFTWASVNVPLSEVPRWPDVPNETGPDGGR